MISGPSLYPGPRSRISVIEVRLSSDEPLREDNGILEVVAAPGHIDFGDPAQGEFAAPRAGAIGEHIAGLDPLGPS